jgi:outer membrane immunogenic protein
MNKLKILLLTGTAVALFSSSAMAADLMMPMKSAPMMAAPMSSNWDGPYIGASIGYGWGTATDKFSTSSVSTANLSGWLAGAQIGYNFHLSDNIVAGIEGNIDWLNETGSYTPSATQTINWEGSVRGRLGYDAGQFLPYVEAGVAFANSTYNSSSAVSNLHTGWTVGAGVEFMLADHLSANVEYRYSDYGSKNYVTGTTNNVHLTDSTVRLGLNYHF